MIPIPIPEKLVGRTKLLNCNTKKSFKIFPKRKTLVKLASITVKARIKVQKSK